MKKLLSNILILSLLFLKSSYVYAVHIAGHANIANTFTADVQVITSCCLIFALGILCSK